MQLRVFRLAKNTASVAEAQMTKKSIGVTNFPRKIGEASRLVIILILEIINGLLRRAIFPKQLTTLAISTAPMRKDEHQKRVILMQLIQNLLINIGDASPCHKKLPT